MLERIAEVFCEVDDFCKWFLPLWQACLLSRGEKTPRTVAGIVASESGRSGGSL
jgi:hypothetical protein